MMTVLARASGTDEAIIIGLPEGRFTRGPVFKGLLDGRESYPGGVQKPMIKGGGTRRALKAPLKEPKIG